MAYTIQFVSTSCLFCCGYPKVTEEETIKPARELTQTSQRTGSEAKQVKGALPEGFFDNKEADLRARGIKPVKPDVK